MHTVHWQHPAQATNMSFSLLCSGHWTHCLACRQSAATPSMNLVLLQSCTAIEQHLWQGFPQGMHGASDCTSALHKLPSAGTDTVVRRSTHCSNSAYAQTSQQGMERINYSQQLFGYLTAILDLHCANTSHAPHTPGRACMVPALLLHTSCFTPAATVGNDTAVENKRTVTAATAH